ncbi:hypothetical protein ACFQ1I_34680 [Kitasatospora arboriphila]
MTGFEHHGFLNVLLAAAAGDRDGAVAALEERSRPWSRPRWPP